jgi:hypothetical protein
MWFSEWIPAGIVFSASTVGTTSSDQVTFRLDGESEFREQETGFLGKTCYDFSASWVAQLRIRSNSAESGSDEKSNQEVARLGSGHRRTTPIGDSDSPTPS